LIEQLLREYPDSGSISGYALLLLRPDGIAPEAVDSLIPAARTTAQDGSAASGNPWGSLALGVAELRAGNPKGALTALELAAGAFNLRCAGAAHAIAAVALGGQLGQHDLARQRLAQGREAFQQLTDGNRQGLGPNWHEMILLDMALQLAGPQVARLEPDTEP
jgi:hypothetical protein